jgi:hypothetical protein
LTGHHHGKAKVRVLKVRHASVNGSGREKHSVSEYKVETRLFSPEYAKVFTDDDNAGLIATDTQKNTVSATVSSVWETTLHQGGGSQRGVNAHGSRAGSASSSEWLVGWLGGSLGETRGGRWRKGASVHRGPQGGKQPAVFTGGQR